MPMLYGEGMRAFQRLQEEIIKTSTDMSLFCWRAKRSDTRYRGLLADSPREFASYYRTALDSRKSISWTSVGSEKEFAVTNKGIRIDAELVSTPHGPGGQIVKALRCNLRPDDYVVLIPIRHFRDNVYIRETPHMIVSSDSAEVENKLIYIAKTVDRRMDQDLAQHMDLRLSFVISPIPPAFRIVPVRCWPAVQWREGPQHFQLTSAKICTCIVVYRLTHNNETRGEFAAICQRNASATQSLRYALVSMSEIGHLFEMLEESTEKNIAALSSMEKFIITGRQTVDIESEGRTFNVFLSKFAPDDEQRLNTLYISIASTAEALYASSKAKDIDPPIGGVKRSKNLEDTKDIATVSRKEIADDTKKDDVK